MDAYSNSRAASDRPMGPAEDADSSGNYAGMAAVAVGGATKAYAQYRSGEINRRIARYNAERTRQQAAQALQAGDFAARRRLLVQQQLTGRTIAQQGSSGTVVGAGTNRLLTKDQENASAMDQFLIRLNASRTADSMMVKAAGDELEGDMKFQAGEGAAIGTLLNTGSQEWLMADAAHEPRMGLAVGGGD